MDQNYGEKQPPSNQQYHGQPPYPAHYNASAPTDFPTPPPQYSVSEQPTYPTLPQQPYAPYAPSQQQPPIVTQQPQQQHVVVHQVPR